MDGEQLCFSLAVYKEKYYADHERNEALSYDTDREDLNVSMLNDYTGAALKLEASTYEESRVLKVAKLCSAVHCGNVDNPKAVTQSVANIVEKWNFCYQKYKDGNPEDPENAPAVDSKCVCFERDNVEADPKMGIEGDVPALVDTVLECTEKIVLHAQNFARILHKAGEAKKMMYLLSGMKLVKNKVLFFKSLFGKIVDKDYMDGDLEDLIQGIFTQVVEYYKGCISNEVLHDAESNDWLSSNPYYENQKISTCIQFWAYTMQGIRADIFNVLNESLARKALHEITKRSLDILAVRYCQVKPSNRRLAQFRADISVILYVAHDMLLSLIPDLNTLFHPDPRNISARSIHQKCLTLLLAQVMIGAPMKNMDRYVEAQVAPQDNPGVPARLEPMQKNEIEKLTCWLHLSFPGIYGHVVERLNTPSFLFVLGRIAAVQPSPNWPILTRLCLARDMEFGIMIMKNFGAFIPGIRGDTVNVRGLCRPCGHLMCSKGCIPVADIHWPQEVGSSVLYVVMHGNPEKEALKKVLSPLLSKLNPSAWGVLNKNMLWNLKRPVWLQGLVDLLEPFVMPVVDEMMDDVESGKTWTLSHVPETITRLIRGLNEVACLVPDSFYEVCAMIKPLVPEEVTPICDSVQVHIFVSCLYGVIAKVTEVFRSWKLQREKVDFLVAVGEKLCNLEATEESRALESQNACVFAEAPKKWDEMPEDMATTMSQLVADKILSDPHGQQALKTIHRFLCYNSEWMQKTLGVTVREVDTLAEKTSTNDTIPVEQPKLQPWEDDLFRTPTPKEMALHLCFYQYNAMLSLQPSWDDCFKILIPDMNPMLLRQLMVNRCEVNDLENSEEADKTSYQNVLTYLNDQLLDKTHFEKPN